MRKLRGRVVRLPFVVSYERNAPAILLVVFSRSLRVSILLLLLLVVPLEMIRRGNSRLMMMMMKKCDGREKEERILHRIRTNSFNKLPTIRRLKGPKGNDTAPTTIEGNFHHAVVHRDEYYC